ncbi:HIT domain-containing protein [Candidatus Dependentiae bacterium]|nr:HIT domain-containing protein [Candidatus Dependentiae bacterium]
MEMFDKNCVFCKIIQKEIPSEIIKETENILVIKDLHPKAPYHYLVIPKKHIVNLNYIKDNDLFYVTEMGKVIRDISKDIQKEKGLNKPLPFNLISNNETEAGQSVFHMHWHFLSGKNFYEGDLKL